MALIVKDRVRETSATTGTGTLTLSGAVSGFQSFSAIGNANDTYYTIVNALTGDWEVGIGTYTASGTTLSRNQVLESSNAGALVNFGAGTKDVFGTYPADRSVSQADIGTAPNEIPLNQYLGSLAYQNAENIAGDVGVGGDLTLNSGTANGVVFLNGSKVATSGTGLAYNSDGILFVNSSLVASSTTKGLQLRFNGTVAGISASQSGVANYPIFLGGDGFNNGLYIDASSNVGVNTSSPATFAPFAVRKGLTIGGVSTSASFSDAANSTFDVRHPSSGIVDLSAQSGSLSFTTGSSEQMRLDSSGHLIVPAGITLGTATGTYNANNTLDDYEEGTWTPVDSSGAGLVFTSASGTYTKIGKLCYITGALTFPATASASTATIGGLPFSVSGGTQYNNYGPPIRNNKSLSMQPFGLNTTTFLLLPIGNYTDYVSNVDMTSGTMLFSFTYQTL